MASSSSLDDAKLKILLFGSIGSEVGAFYDKLLALHKSKAGPFDAAFCVGACSVGSLIQHIVAKKNNDNKQQPHLASLPLPVYVQEPFESIDSLVDHQQNGKIKTAQEQEQQSSTDSALSSSSTTTANEEENEVPPNPLLQVHPNLYILRNKTPPYRASVWSLAVLEQNDNRKTQAGGSASRRRRHELVVAACPSHLRSDSDQAKDLMQQLKHVSYRGCDLLLSTEWPQGIETVLHKNSGNSPVQASNDGKGSFTQDNTQNLSFDIADVALQARARYHVAASTVANQFAFAQSTQPFQHIASMTSTVPIYHGGRFLALGSVVDSTTLKQRGGSKATKFVHALGLKPFLQMSVPELCRDSGGGAGSAAALLPCPFTDAVYQTTSTTNTATGSTLTRITGGGGGGGLSEARARRILAEEERFKPSGLNVAAQRWSSNNKNKISTANGDNKNLDETEIDPTNQTLFVHGLHKDVTGVLQSNRGDGVLLQAFAQVSNQAYRAIRIRKPPNAPTSSFCFVDFPSHEQALQCWRDFHVNGITISGVQLEVKWATQNNTQNKRFRGSKDAAGDDEETYLVVNNKRTRLTEATAQDSSTVYFKLPPNLSSSLEDREKVGETLRLWMERTLEDALAPPPSQKEDSNDDDAPERITAADEPALRVQTSTPDNKNNNNADATDAAVPANYGFLEFASHAAASMALATLTGSTDGGLILPDAPRLPAKEYEGLRLHWGRGKKVHNDKNLIEDTSGFKFERKHFPADSREGCWFCLASDACEKHLITGLYDRCYTTMPKGPIHRGHILIVPVLHESQGALKNAATAQEIETIKALLCHHTALVYEMDLFVFERAIQTKGGYHTHVQCIPIPQQLGLKLQATMMAQARKIGIPLREVSSDLGMTALVGNDDDSDGYFYAEINTTRILALSSSSLGTSALPQITTKRFLYKASKSRTPSATSSSLPVVPLQFGREILAAVLGKPELAHWKDCVASKEEETKLAKELRDSLAPYTASMRKNK